MFRYDTGRHIWSGCISLHQAPRISCPLDSTVTIFPCRECFSLFRFPEPTLLEKKTFFFRIAPGGMGASWWEPPAALSRNVGSGKRQARNVLNESPKKIVGEPAPLEKIPRGDTGELDRLAPPQLEGSRGDETVSRLAVENEKPGWRPV